MTQVHITLNHFHDVNFSCRMFFIPMYRQSASPSYPKLRDSDVSHYIPEVPVCINM